MTQKATRPETKDKDDGTTANEPGTTIVSQHWKVERRESSQTEASPKQDGKGAKGLREAHFTATEEGTTAPANDKLVEKE